MNLRLAGVVAAVALALAGCGSSPPPAPPTSAAPTPDQQLLTQAHTERWPATDSRILELAHQQCPAPGTPPRNTPLAESYVVLETKFSQSQARSLVYTARRLYCPDALGS